MFEQTHQPGNWDAARYGAWEGPLNVLLVPKLPSAHRSGYQYSVCILYRPANQPSNLLGPNHPLRYPGTAGYLRAVCCGPSKDRGCPVGARVVGPCAHGVTALFLGCVLPQFPVIIIINHHSFIIHWTLSILFQQQFRSTHQNTNIYDPGNGLPIEATRDLLTGLVN